jgi:hypothetical protein
MTISATDRVLFLIRRIYNRTIGKYIFSCDFYGPTIFGISCISKSAVERMFSTKSDRKLKDGLTTSEYQKLRSTLDSIRILPRPELPSHTFSDEQKDEFNIRQIGNLFYIFLRRDF